MHLLVLLGKRLNNDRSFKREMLERCDYAYNFITANKCDKILLCGGMPNKKAGVTEASAMRDYLIEKGVSSDNLILEEDSLTTKQNAYFAAPIIKDLGVKAIYLCSSARHLKRFYLNPIELFEKYLDNKVKIFPLSCDII